jgi:uncharacterized membrane protein (DUF106 family)
MLKTISLFFDMVLAPFAGLHPMVGLTVLSIVMGVVMVLLYRWTTDQDRLRQIRDRIKILFLEIRLYKDDMAEMFTIQKEIMRENFRYLRYTAKSAVILMVPIILVLIDLNVRYSYRPIQPGESFIVSAFAEETAILDRLELTLPQGLAVEVPGIRVPEEKRVSWQLRAGTAGHHALVIHQGKQENGHVALVSNKIERLVPEIDKGTSWTSHLVPEASFLPDDCPVASLRVEYPERMSFLGLQPGWLYYFFIISMAAGLVVKKFLGLA